MSCVCMCFFLRFNYASHEIPIVHSQFEAFARWKIVSTLTTVIVVVTDFFFQVSFHCILFFFFSSVVNFQVGLMYCDSRLDLRHKTYNYYLFLCLSCHTQFTFDKIRLSKFQSLDIVCSKFRFSPHSIFALDAYFFLTFILYLSLIRVFDMCVFICSVFVFRLQTIV